MKPSPALCRALREYAQEEGKSKAEQILSDARAREKLQAYLAREVATLQPVFSFRDSETGIEIEADDPHGLVSPSHETVRLKLFHLLRFYDWKVKEAPHSKESNLKVILQDISEPPLQVSWMFRFDGSWEDFQRRYTKKPTALRGLKLRRHQQGSIVPIPKRITEAVLERYVPCLILDVNDLKPWHWDSLGRDGIDYTDLDINFTEGSSSSRKLRLLYGLDGYKVMGRYGWSLERKTGEGWIT